MELYRNKEQRQVLKAFYEAREEIARLSQQAAQIQEKEDLPNKQEEAIPSSNGVLLGNL